jgi:hypothetical protein
VRDLEVLLAISTTLGVSVKRLRAFVQRLRWQVALSKYLSVTSGTH